VIEWFATRAEAEQFIAEVAGELNPEDAVLLRRRAIRPRGRRMNRSAGQCVQARLTLEAKLIKRIRELADHTIKRQVDVLTLWVAKSDSGLLATRDPCDR
jgi:thioesterase domain-containing protein